MENVNKNVTTFIQANYKEWILKAFIPNYEMQALIKDFFIDCPNYYMPSSVQLNRALFSFFKSINHSIKWDTTRRIGNQVFKGRLITKGFEPSPQHPNKILFQHSTQNIYILFENNQIIITQKN